MSSPMPRSKWKPPLIPMQEFLITHSLPYVIYHLLTYDILYVCAYIYTHINITYVCTHIYAQICIPLCIHCMYNPFMFIAYCLCLLVEHKTPRGRHILACFYCSVPALILCLTQSKHPISISWPNNQMYL